MWINERLRADAAVELPFRGRVTRAEGSRVDVDSFMRLTGVACVCGTAGTPVPGDEVVILPGMDGYYCIGRVAAPDGGETDSAALQRKTAEEGGL